jgi:hypothetical protein
MSHNAEFPLLLSQGSHSYHLGPEEALLSGRRPEIMAGFEAIFERAKSLGLSGSIWVDGSFLTKDRAGRHRGASVIGSPVVTHVRGIV